MFFSVAIKYSLVSFIQFAIKKLNFFFVGLFCLLTPVKKNKIVFSSFEGAWLGCNPKYILKELLKQNLPFEIVWLKNKETPKNIEFKDKIKYVDYKNKLAVLKELASAKIWIDNTLKTDLFKLGLIKKENQFYINTWHGSLGIKKLFYDTDNYSPSDEYKELLKKEFDYCDLMISNCDWEENVYKSAMKYSNEIKKLGHPRNDIFFEDSKEYKNKICKEFNIDSSQKLAIYMPTYRNSLSNIYYDLDFAKLKKTLEEKFKGNWTILVRSHNFNLKKNIFKNQEVYDVSFYPDSQELLAASDILISDYSSCMFDFALAKKPCFVYAKDIEEYNIERGLYYSFNKTPFLVAKNNDELTQNIANFDEYEYQKKCNNFLNEREVLEDGKASYRIVELLKSIMGYEI